MLDLLNMRPPKPGEAPPMTLTTDGWVCRTGPFCARGRPAGGDFDITVDHEKGVTLIGIAPGMTSNKALRNLSILERARLTTAPALTVARLGAVSARPTVDPDGQIWVDVWVDKGPGRNGHLLARLHVTYAVTNEEALLMLRPWAARVAAEDARVAKFCGERLIRATPKPIIVREILWEK